MSQLRQPVCVIGGKCLVSFCRALLQLLSLKTTVVFELQQRHVFFCLFSVCLQPLCVCATWRVCVLSVDECVSLSVCVCVCVCGRCATGCLSFFNPFVSGESGGGGEACAERRVVKPPLFLHRFHPHAHPHQILIGPAAPRLPRVH